MDTFDLIIPSHCLYHKNNSDYSLVFIESFKSRRIRIEYINSKTLYAEFSLEYARQEWIELLKSGVYYKK